MKKFYAVNVTKCLNDWNTASYVDDENESSKEKIHYSVDTESSLISNILVGDIYDTREELMEAENRGEGKINWEYFDDAVKRVRGLLKWH